MFDLNRITIAVLSIAIGLLGIRTSEAQVTSSTLDELEQTAFQNAADYAQDCCVQIETFGGQEIVNKQFVAAGPSTGTVLTADGWIITSMLQFRGQPASITVILPDEQRKAAKLVARDYSRELALLKIDTDRPLRFASASPKNQWQVGQWTIALGKTFDFKVASRSVGILSAQGRIFNKAVQSDAKISPQNYGGPLIDLRGDVMGILAPMNPGIATEGEVEQWYDSGVGFAVPLEDVLSRLGRMQTGEDIHPGKAGFRSNSADEFAPEIVLSGVTPGSPAAKAGMRTSDRIVGAGATKETVRTVAMHSELKHVMGTVDAGNSMVFDIDRMGSRMLIEVTLVKELPIYKEPYLGVLIDPLSPSTMPKVIAVVPQSPAEKSGIVAGDVIVSVAGNAIEEQNKLDARLAFIDYRDPIELQLKNADGAERAVTVQLTTTPSTDLDWASVQIPVPEKTAETQGAKGIVQLPLGDVKNKAFAIVPSNYCDELAHGLLLVYADAGQQDQKQWSDAWDVFSRENRWIVVVAQSADDKAWSFEEVELSNRLRTYMGTTYKIDRRRMCVAGISAGMLPAYVSAMQSPETYRGIWLSNAKISQRTRILAAEPLKSFHLFLNGTEPTLPTFVDLAKKAGHSVELHPEELTAAKMTDAPLLVKVQRWLRLMETH
jgi:serine protease Do